MTYEQIGFETEGSVAVVTLNRPARREYRPPFVALQAARPDVAVSFGHVHPVAGALELARKAAREARLTQTT